VSPSSQFAALTRLLELLTTYISDGFAHKFSGLEAKMALTLGTIIYVAILLINAMAVLSEDRFLARIGWSSAQASTVAAGFQTYGPPYDQTGLSGQDAGVKVRLINLISAVRTLMRIPLIGMNLVIIVYELILGH